jgi:hypothetical protein
MQHGIFVADDGDEKQDQKKNRHVSVEQGDQISPFG